MDRNRAYIDIHLPLDPSFDTEGFNHYRQSEKLAVTSKRVLADATLLAIKNGSLFFAEIDHDTWWRNHLSVEFPIAPDVMRVEVRGASLNEVKILASSLSNSYLANMSVLRVAARKREIKSEQAAKQIAEKLIDRIKINQSKMGESKPHILDDFVKEELAKIEHDLASETEFSEEEIDEDSARFKDELQSVSDGPQPQMLGDVVTYVR